MRSDFSTASIYPRIPLIPTFSRDNVATPPKIRKRGKRRSLRRQKEKEEEDEDEEDEDKGVTGRSKEGLRRDVRRLKSRGRGETPGRGGDKREGIGVLRV